MKKILRFLKYIIIFFFVSTILVTISYGFINPPITYLMVKRLYQQIRDKKPVKLQKEWVSIDKISNNVIKSAIAGEDKLFMEHYGFDFDAIKKAHKYNSRGKKIKGGSTISQQTAKNVFLGPSRTMLRKGFEAYFTLLIEIFWSKKRIMEVYLNVIETGDGVYGIERASEVYFGKSAAKLNLNEASLIIASLPNPLKHNPSKPNRILYKRQSLILKNVRFTKCDF